MVGRAVRVDDHVTRLAREAVVAMDQPAPAHEPAADPGAEGDEHVVVAASPGAEFALGPLVAGALVAGGEYAALGWVGGGLLVVAGALLVAVELVVPPIRAEA